MPQATTERKERVSLRTYDAARQMEELMLSRSLPGETKDMLAGLLHRYAAAVGVDLAHPALVRAVIVEIARARREMPEGEAEKKKADALRLDFYSWVGTAHAVAAKHEGEEGAEHL